MRSRGPHGKGLHWMGQLHTLLAYHASTALGCSQEQESSGELRTAVCVHLMCVTRVVCCGEIGAVGGPGSGAGKNGARLLEMAAACNIQIIDKVPKPPYEPITKESRVLFRDDLP